MRFLLVHPTPPQVYTLPLHDALPIYLPLLYDAGVVYRRELDETWCDFLNMLAQGHEDCDGLAAARAGELLARGWAADRKSTRLNSSHLVISYAVFCLKKKKQTGEVLC